MPVLGNTNCRELRNECSDSKRRIFLVGVEVEVGVEEVEVVGVMDEIPKLVSRMRQLHGVRGCSEKSNLSAATISRLERGLKPDIETLVRLCNWLKVSPNQLLGFGSKFPKVGPCKNCRGTGLVSK